MKYARLIKENKIRKEKAYSGQIKDLFSLAERDLKTAEFTATQDWDWAFAIAYNSVLQACRAYMLSRGYRSRSVEAHKITFEFMRLALNKEYLDLINYFDRCRIKRHKTVYQSKSTITETELKQLLSNAKLFVLKLKELCKGKL
jgi:uncharacterized protein (UPF0332 family)